jgi:hypothetical protein
LNNFLDYIEKYKWAIFGTVFIHIIVFIIMLLSTVTRPIKYVEDEVVAQIEEIDLEDVKLEQIIDPLTGQVTNAVRDLNDKREASQDHFSKSQEDQNAMDKTKAFEEAYRRELESKHQPLKEYKTTSKGVDLGDKNNQKTTSQSNNQVSGNVLVSYELTGRKSHSLPKPGYLCPGSGKVVMKIKVDKSGKVFEANPISSMCLNATPCMLQVASKYAKKSRFDYKGSGGIQEGKIYYTFVGQ